MSKQVLSIKINNKNSIELNQLTLSLNALACQYDSFLRKSEEFDYDKPQRKLCISKLESGSLYVELLPVMIPLLDDFNTIMAFLSYLKNIFDVFLGKTQDLFYNLTKKDCHEISNFVGQIANDSGSSINLECKGNINSPISIIINSTEANAIQNQIRRYSENTYALPEKYSKVLMYWANACFMKNKVNDKVIIEHIDKKETFNLRYLG